MSPFLLLALIPFVGLIWIFKGGTPGSNRFGAPAPANTLGVKILGLLWKGLSWPFRKAFGRKKAEPATETPKTAAPSKKAG